MKSNRLVIVLLLVGVLSAYYLFKPATENNLAQRNSQLIVGIASGYAPFVSTNEQGVYEGFDIDVAQALAQVLGKDLVLRDLGSMTSLFTALNQGQVDLLIWGLSITQERLNKVAMVHYYGSNLDSYPLIFWQEIPVGVKSLNDLAGQVVCCEPGSAQEMILDQYDLISKLPVEKIDDALLNIQYGKAVAALVEPAIAKKFGAKYAQIKSLNVPISQEMQEQGIGIVIQSERGDLIRQVQTIIKKLKTAGVINQLAQKWGLEV